MHNNIAWISLVGSLLLACNNPAPLAEAAEAAGASAALDRPGRACQLAEHASGSPSPEETRGLYSAPTPDGGELQCTGSYAVRIDLDVYAQDSASESEHDPGRGRASVWLRAELDASSQMSVQLCGLELPARYAYASSGVTQLQLPDAIWERSTMPTWQGELNQAFPVLLGIALREPGAAWPSFDQTTKFDCGGTECFPDHDGDGEPGLSFATRGEGEVEDAPYPACANWQPRAPSTEDHVWSSHSATDAGRLFVGLRTALQLFPRFDATCAHAAGPARAADIVTRVLDCELTDGQRCSPRQAVVIDERAPLFHVLEAGETPPESFRDSRRFVDEALDRTPSEGGQVTLRRLADAATCEAVRATFAQ